MVEVFGRVMDAANAAQQRVVKKALSRVVRMRWECERTTQSATKCLITLSGGRCGSERANGA